MSSIHPQYVPVVFFPLFTEVTTGHISRINAELPQGCKLEGVFLWLSEEIASGVNCNSLDPFSLAALSFFWYQ